MPISSDLYSFQTSQLGFTYSELRRNIVDIKLLYDLLNGFIDSHELLFLMHFNII